MDDSLTSHGQLRALGNHCARNPTKEEPNEVQRDRSGRHEGHAAHEQLPAPAPPPGGPSRSPETRRPSAPPRPPLPATEMPPTSSRPRLRLGSASSRGGSG